MFGVRDLSFSERVYSEECQVHKRNLRNNNCCFPPESDPDGVCTRILLDKRY